MVRVRLLSFVEIGKVAKSNKSVIKWLTITTNSFGEFGNVAEFAKSVINRLTITTNSFVQIRQLCRFRTNSTNISLAASSQLSNFICRVTRHPQIEDAAVASLLGVLEGSPLAARRAE